MPRSSYLHPGFLATSIGISALTALTIMAWTTTSTRAAQASCLPASLKVRLAQIRKRFGSVRIISTSRAHARISGTRYASYHASCRAVDIIPPKGKFGAVASWLRANHSGGVGTCEPEGEADQDRRQGRAPWPLRHLSDGRGCGAEGIVPGNLVAHRRTATKTGSCVGIGTIGCIITTEIGQKYGGGYEQIIPRSNNSYAFVSKWISYGYSGCWAV